MERELLLLYIMATFTGVAAIALVIQMVFLFGIFRAVKVLQTRATAFLDRLEPIAETSHETLEDVRKQTAEILAKVQELADSTRGQVRKFDSILNDLSDSAHRQMDRVDHTVEITLERLDETFNEFQKAVLLPIRQIRGVAAAAGAILDYLAGRRRTVDQATLDEEMFI